MLYRCWIGSCRYSELLTPAPVPTRAPAPAPIAAPRPPPIAAPRPAPRTVPRSAPPTALVFACSAAPAICPWAYCLQTASSSAKTLKGLLGAGITCTVGPIGCVAQALSRAAVTKPTIAVLVCLTTCSFNDRQAGARLAAKPHCIERHRGSSPGDH